MLYLNKITSVDFLAVGHQFLQRFSDSINKASKGTRFKRASATNGSTVGTIWTVFLIRHDLQNQVPKVRVLVPLPKKSLENPVFMRVSRLFCFSNLFSLCHHFSLFSTIFRINCNTNCNTDS